MQRSTAYSRGMRSIILALVVVSAVPALSQCGFHYDSVSIVKYYRAEGWKLLGIEDNLHTPAQTYGLPSALPIPGFEARIIRHESPNIVTFPAQEFALDGTRQKMRAAQVEVRVLRWTSRGHTVAYSYGLSPASAHREKGKWVFDTEVGCIFEATFIDDKGDGVFRILVPAPFTADLVPSWARETKE